MRVQKTFDITLVASSSDWTPAAGQNVSIATNGIADVQDPPGSLTDSSLASGQQHWHCFDQSGMIWNPYYGANGAIMRWGGGHLGRKNNAVDACPIEQDAVWRHLTKSYQNDDYRLIRDATNKLVPNDWYDISGFFTGEFLQDGSAVGNNNYGDYIPTQWDVNSKWFGNSPATTHTRGNVIVVPGGTGGRGQMVVPFIHGNYAGEGFRYAHIFDCGTEDWNALTLDPDKTWWRRGGRLPIPTTDGTVPNGLPTNGGMYQGAAVWFEPDQNRIGVMGTTFESAVSRTIFYLGTDAHPTNKWTYFVGPRAAGGVFPYMNADCGSCYVPHRRLLMWTQPPNNINGGATPGTNGCVQFSMIDLSNPTATFFTPVQMKFANPQQGPMMPYTTAQASPANKEANDLVGADPIYCEFDGALWMVWSSRHLPVCNPPYELGDVTVWRLRPVSRDLKGTDTNAQIMADNWEWTDMTNSITPRLEAQLLRFILAPVNSGGTGGTSLGVLDYIYRGLAFIPSLNCFVFNRGSHGAASPFFGTVQLFRPSGF